LKKPIRIEETYKSHMEEKQCLEDEIIEKKEKRENILTDHLKERPEDLNELEAKSSQQERGLEEEIISLKIQLEEAKRME
jgi:hypothetical protein